MIRNRVFPLLLALVLTAACSRNTSPATSALDDDRQAVEAALTKYLSERGTINVAAIDVKIEDLKISGDRADAQVMFRTKQGEGEMRMAYVLTRQNHVWTVQAPPRSESSIPHGVAVPQSQSPTALPSGHPPITTPAQPPAKKP